MRFLYATEAHAQPDGLGAAPSLDVDKSIRLIFRPPSVLEVEQQRIPTYRVVVEATLRRKASGNNATAVRELAEGRIPQLSRVPANDQRWRQYLDGNGVLHANYILPQDFLPEGLASLFSSGSRELHSSAKRVFQLALWRSGDHRVQGIGSPFSRWWSLDGSDARFPVPTSTTLGIIRQMDLRVENEAEEISSVMSPDASEPVGHELLREATALRTSNPRSALIIAVTALEVSTKHLIAERVPEAAWLVRELPMPPVEQILRGYFQQLPLARWPKNLAQEIPEMILYEVKAAVSARNGIVHRGEPAPDYEAMKRFLLVIADLLWLFDYCRGHEWALEYVSDVGRALLAF